MEFADLDRLAVFVRVRHWLREPLVQFLLGGLAVFVLSLWQGADADPASRTITISEPQVERLAANFAQTWQRPPSTAEIDGLIRDYVKEEVYNREAKAMGLDIDDAIIRRRLRSKMEFLAKSEIEQQRPDDATLQAWLDRDPARYAAGAVYSFDQVFLDALKEGDSQHRAKRLLARLNQGQDWRGVGDPISLPASQDAADRAAIARTFGDEFLQGLSGLKSEVWSGPIVSGFGLHLVRVRKVETAGKPRLADVRQQVENDWRAQTAADREAKAYQALLDGYTIRIAKP